MRHGAPSNGFSLCPFQVPFAIFWVRCCLPSEIPLLAMTGPRSGRQHRDVRWIKTGTLSSVHFRLGSLVFPSVSRRIVAIAAVQRGDWRGREAVIRSGTPSCCRPSFFLPLSGGSVVTFRAQPGQSERGQWHGPPGQALHCSVPTVGSVKAFSGRQCVQLDCTNGTGL